MAGQTITYNGFIYEVQPNGSARKVAPVQTGLPPNPIKVQQAQTDIAQGQAGIRGQEIENRVKNATANAAIRKAQAEAAGAEADARGKNRALALPQVMSDDQRKALAQRGNLDSLVSQINRTQQLYEGSQDGGGFMGLGSLAEYLPSQANAQFDAAAAGLAEQGLSAFRVPGVGSQSDAELKQFVEANKPSSWSMDSSNKERLRQMRQRTENIRRELGMPAPQWRVSNEERVAANTGLATGFRSLTGLMQNMTPAQRKAALARFNADPRVQSLKSRSGFRDPGGSSPRNAGGQPRVIDFNDLP